jgi:hypothetical protein
MLCIVKVAIGWVVLMIVGTTLVNFVVRDLVPSPEMRELETTMPAALAGEMTRYKRANGGVTLFFGALAVLYLYLLFWNLGVVAAAAMLMVARLPDVLWEIRTGQKVKKGNMPKAVVNYAASILDWAAIPVLWFSLC